jgi:hypothetical protein
MDLILILDLAVQSPPSQYQYIPYNLKSSPIFFYEFEGKSAISAINEFHSLPDVELKTSAIHFVITS